MKRLLGLVLSVGGGEKGSKFLEIDSTRKEAVNKVY